MIKKNIKYKFGEKLRAVRERKGITLKKVAELASVSESMVSQIERNIVSPSIDTLLSVADALGLDHEYLFSDFKKTKEVTIVRKDNRHTITLDEITMQQISVIDDIPDDHAIEAFILEIKPGSEKGSMEYGHAGKEFGLILKGEGKLSYGTEEYDLKSGDSVNFPSDIPHILKNCGENTLEAIWIITPPRMFFPGQKESSE